MESSRQKFDRLTQALAEIIDLEAASLAAGDSADLADIQHRAGSVVDAIVALPEDVRDAAARAKVASLLSRRQGNIDLMECQIATLSEEMQAVQASTGRMARIAPAYGRTRLTYTGAELRAAG